MIKKTSLFIIATFLIFSCDTDKFLGYNYDADALIESASISGKVTNTFTGNAVFNASVQIGDQVSLTDGNGHYVMNYFLTEDDNLNREAPIVVTAQNFHSFTSSQVIFPTPTELNFAIEYASPIIEATGFYNLTYCQAIILDYQGTEDIDSVYSHFRYINNSGFVVQEIDVALALHNVVSQNRAYYQAKINPLFPGEADSLRVSRTYSITAIDKSGFTGFKDHTNNIYAPDDLLFDTLQTAPKEFPQMNIN